MSKSKKVTLIVAVSCIGAGLVIAFIAVMMIGFDFTKLNTMEFKTKTYEVQENFQNIDIRDIECDIRLAEATDGQCKVICKESDKITNSVSVENSTLKVIRKDMRPWYEHIHIGVWWVDELSVTVYLPESQYQALYLKSVSGDIEVPDNFSFYETKLNSTSGKISFMGITNGNLYAQSISGDISVKNAAGESVKIVTTSGKIFLSDITTTELNVETTSGDVKSTSVVVSGRADLKAVSGNIKMDDSDAGSFQIKTVSGDVEGSILSAKNFVTNTTSGDVIVPSSNPHAGSCKITTTSGDIEINIIS